MRLLKKADRDSGRTPGIPADVSEKLKALERVSKLLAGTKTLVWSFLCQEVCQGSVSFVLCQFFVRSRRLASRSTSAPLHGRLSIIVGDARRFQRFVIFRIRGRQQPHLPRKRAATRSPCTVHHYGGQTTAARLQADRQECAANPRATAYP